MCAVGQLGGEKQQMQFAGRNVRCFRRAFDKQIVNVVHIYALRLTQPCTQVAKQIGIAVTTGALRGRNNSHRYHFEYLLPSIDSFVLAVRICRLDKDRP